MTKLSNSLKVADRMGEIHTKDAYILFKDQKPNFSNNTQSRLINSTKSKLGIISKNIILKITDKFLITTDANLWKDSFDAIKWFVNMSNVLNNNGPLTVKLQKKIIRPFKLVGFKIDITSNLKIVSYLDVTLNLNTNIFKPYHKEHETPNYINVDSDQPKTNLKQIPITVGSSVSKLSSNKYIFNKNKDNDNALLKSGFKNKLSYLNPKSNMSMDKMTCKHRNRKRNIVWFNPCLL